MICGACKESKPEEEFSFKNVTLSKRHTHCRQCQRIYKRNHYDRNKQEYKSRSALAKIRSIKRNQKFIIAYLAVHPCVGCGDTDPLVLEFDHRDNKIKAVSQLARDGCSIQTIVNEIAKCEVRCANCHRRKTRIQFGWLEGV